MNILFNWSDRRWPETKRGEDKGEEAAKITLFSPQKNHIVSPNTNYPIIPNYPIPFLDCPVSRDDNLLRTTVYRKPTHTDRLLDESSYNPTSHKATTIRTLTRRAQLVCTTTDSLSDENKYLNRVFSKNNYNEDFIQRNAHRPTTTTEANDNTTPTTTATIPYIKGISENISRIL